jgi:hypothetical protein
LWCFCKLQRNWNFVIVEFFSTFSLGAIIVKQANSDKGLNRKWVFFEHFDFFMERNFWRIFFATWFFKILKSPPINLIFLNYFWINMNFLKCINFARFYVSLWKMIIISNHAKAW